jgi:hypothetical protein
VPSSDANSRGLDLNFSDHETITLDGCPCKRTITHPIRSTFMDDLMRGLIQYFTLALMALCVVGAATGLWLVR